MRPERRPRWHAGLLALPLLLIAVGLFSNRWQLGPGSAQPADLPSTTVLDQSEVALGLPVASIWVEPAGLEDPITGILANVHSRGRAWERAGALSYFDEGRLQFSTRVGVRVHGGGSRYTSPVQSFRVYFRSEYGAEAFGPGLMFDGAADPVRRLIFHNDLRQGPFPSGGEGDWAFGNPLAYDIAERIGAIVPHTQPVRFFLNGEWAGVYVVTEYVDVPDNPEFFRVRFGHDRFSADLPAMEELWRWIRALGRPLLLRQLAERIDVENMTKWFLSAAFCATGDAFQGPGQFHDDTRERGAWFWINWDMDQSFRAADLDSFYDLLQQPGERRRGRRDSEPRSYAVTAMLVDDPEYRAYFMREFTRMLNHQVTPEFLDDRYRHYEAMARTYGVEDLRFLAPLRAFLSGRHDMLWRLADRHLSTGSPVALRLAAPAGGVLVDGSLVEGSFEGRYFPGTTLELALPAATSRTVSHWDVDGTPRAEGARELRMRVDADVTVAPVLR